MVFEVTSGQKVATLLLVPGVKYDDIHQNRSKTCIVRIITILLYSRYIRIHIIYIYMHIFVFVS